ncbi:MAG: hypothetical protein KGN39_10560 [Betaproteobacteria bacterium]|nr:hypothetical protein [Betaproteobacteria bacterium]
MNRKVLATAIALTGLALLGGCASVPTGPSVMALPGTGKNFEEFRRDDAECRYYARSQVGGTADESATSAGVRSAAVGTVVGAVAGAAIGGRDAAGVGAGTGLVVGSMAGTGAAQSSAYGTQRHYDNAYVQCMYAKGNKVPVAGTMVQPPVQRQVAPAGGAYSPPPPPPPGNPPPPPPNR